MSISASSLPIYCTPNTLKQFRLTKRYNRSLYTTDEMNNFNKLTASPFVLLIINNEWFRRTSSVSLKTDLKANLQILKNYKFRRFELWFRPFFKESYKQNCVRFKVSHTFTKTCNTRVGWNVTEVNIITWGTI